MTVTGRFCGGRPVSELGTSAADTGAFFHIDSGGCSEQGEELSGGGWSTLQFGSTAMKLAMLWLVLVGMSVYRLRAKLRSVQAEVEARNCVFGRDGWARVQRRV